MEAILTAIAEKIVDYAVAPIGRQFGYMLCYKSNVDELKKEVEILQAARDSLQHSVDGDQRSGREIDDRATNWLGRVDGKIEETKRLQEDGGHANARCSTWPCPNLLSRYKLSRRAKKMVQAITELQKEDKFDRNPHQTLPNWIEAAVAPSATDHKVFDFESRTTTLYQIMEMLKDPNISLIGVYGLGGVGKTTLVKEVARKAQEEKLFDVVAWADVTQKPELDKIQSGVAEMLGLKLEEQNEIVRAGRLRERLKKEKSVLVILDDLWARLDLGKIGIPFGGDHKGCRILLTSRNVNILSNQMGTQKDFLIGFMPEEEAWTLFKDMAEINDLNEDVDLLATAREVSRECAGLPIALVTVARALKKKSLSEWRDALRQLRRPTTSRDIAVVVDSSIKLSYDHLENQELKDIFLLCAPIGYNIDKLYLLKCCVGLGLFKDILTIGEARDRLDTLIHKLKASCLLLDHPSGNLTMHDVVCDVAQSIASKHQHALYVRYDDKFDKWPDSDELELCTAITLLYCDIGELPEGLDCPQLNFFVIGSKEPSLKIPDSFFKGMSKLRVLDLTGVHLLFLPSSITFLRNLQTLCLEQCILEEIAAVGELKNLKVLSLFTSDIKKLPNEIGGLTQLQLLDLTRCSKLVVIPPNVISSMKKLEELRMEKSFVRWKDEGANNENASLAELNQLPDLTALDIHVRDSSILPTDLFSQRLERYKILIGDVWNWAGKHETSRTLKLSLNKNFYLQKGLQILLKRVEDLYLDQVAGVKNVSGELDKEGFSYLKNLHVQNNGEIQYIIDSIGRNHTQAPFPKLENLVLHNLVNLEKIYHGQLSVPTFCKLTVIKVSSCDKLKNLFSFSVVKNLSQLQEVEVSNCNFVEEVVTLPNEEILDDNNQLGVLEFLQLKILTLQHLPALNGFYLDEKTSSAKEQNLVAHAPNELHTHNPLFSNKVALPKLETLKLSSIDFRNIWHHQLVAGFSFYNLKSLMVDKCEFLSIVITSHLLRSLSNLEELQVQNCNSVEVVYDLEGMTTSTTRLRKLTLSQLPKLKHIWNKDPQGIVKFENLEAVTVEQCYKLKDIFHASVAKSLRKLELLKVESCYNVEETVAEEERAESNTMFAFPRMKILRLANLWELKCFYPGMHIIECPLLTELYIINCDKLVQFGRETSNLQQPLFSIKQVMQNLEELTLDSKNTQRIWHGEILIDHFPKLKLLRLQSFESEEDSFPYWILQRIPCLVQLMVGDSLFKEIFPFRRLSGIEEGQVETIARLKMLNLRWLSKLEHICKEGSQLDPSLEILEQLYVRECPNLINIVPSTVSFSHLTILEVWECAKLVNLVTSPTAKSLVQLKTLDIKNCKLMEEIVSNSEHEEDEEEIEFRHLQILELVNLPRLTRFSSINCNMKFPCLEGARVKGCPKMKTFSNRIPTTPKLDNIQVEETEDKLYWEGNLNSTIENLYINKVWLLSTELLNFSDFLEYKDTWHKPVQNWSYCSLKSLVVDKCEFLSSVISSNLLPILNSLEELQVQNCDSMEVVFDLEGVDGVATHTVTICRLRKLSLSCLPNLKHLWNRDPQGMLDHQNLQLINVSKCQSLKNLFPAFVAKRLPKLEELEIMDSGIEEIVAKQEGIEAEVLNFVFPLVKKLTLMRLEQYKSFYPGTFTLKWPLLEKLEVNIKSGFNVFESEILSFKETLERDGIEVQDHEPLFLFEKNIWHHQLVAGVFPGCKEISFCSLKSLMVDNCEFLSVVITSHLLRSLSNLEELQVQNCNSVEVVYDLEGMTTSTTRLRKLTLSQLPKLKHIWNKDPQGIVKFENLEAVTIEHCYKLKDIFPASVAKSLLKLELLEVDSCINVEEIVAEEERAESNTRFAFPRMKSLTLFNLWELKSFYPGMHIIECPLLTALYVIYCDTLVQFGRETSNLQQPLFSIKQVMQNLEELTLDSKNTQRIWHGEILIDHFPKLKCLRLQSFQSEEDSFPYWILQRIPCLVQLIVLESLFKEIFPFRRLSSIEEGQMETIARLKMLRLQRLSKLEHICKEGSQLDPSLEILEELCVWECPNLINIVPSTVSFSHLTILMVWECAKLVNLVTSPTAKSLVQLKTLDIKNCKMMEEIVSNSEHEEDEEEIEFRHLQILELVNLPSLTRFSSINCNIKFPCLEDTRVKGCPKMKTFSNRIPTTPKLDNIQVEETEDKLYWEGNLNSTIENLYKNKVLLLSTELLRLSDFPEYKDTWHKPVQNWSYCSLKSLVVDKCEFLSFVISSNLLPILNSLEELQVQNCDSMEVVFDLEGVDGVATHTVTICRLRKLSLSCLPNLKHLWNRDPQGMLDHQNLQLINVSKCQSLKNLFPASVAKRLPKLEELEIMECGIEEIVAKQEGIEAEVLNFVFPLVKKVTLRQLEQYKSFYPGTFNLKWPLLEKLDVYIKSGLNVFESDILSFKDHKPLCLFEKNIWHDQLVAGVFPGCKEISFCSLKSLMVDNCEFLSVVITSHLLRSLSNLEELQVQNCNSVEVVYDLEGMTTSTTRLRKLTLSQLPKLKHIWNKDPQGIVKFENLEAVTAEHCYKLKDIFPASVAKSLQKLELLKVDSCCIEEIVAEEERAESNTRFAFPRMKNLILFNLWELKSFYPGMHIIECPLLTELYILNCHKLVQFGRETSNLQQPLFSIKQVMQNLEQLTLDSENTQRIWHGEILIDLFPKLKFLRLQSFESEEDSFPYWILQRIPCLVQLIVLESLFKEIFPFRRLSSIEEGQMETIVRLKMLWLQRLSKLEHICKEGSQLDPSLGILEELYVGECPNLINIVPSTVSFSHLTILEVWECVKLVNLVTSPTAKSLVQLKTLDIKNCKLMEEIVSNSEHEEDEEEIEFRHLQILNLVNLPSLTRFSSINCNMKFPCLEDTRVKGCPKMKTFSNRIPTTPKLDNIQVEETEDKLYWEGNLNSTIENLYRNKVLL